MKRSLILAAALVLASGVAYAGDWHTGGTLNCTDCHVMHAQTSHTYTGGATTTTYSESTYLLKGAVNDMCLSCHDQGSISDVLGAHSTADVNRSAGALNLQGMTLDSEYSDYDGHSLGSMAPAPGGTFAATDGLSCVDCHHQHGYAGFGTQDAAGNPVTNAYRNLRALGGTTISYTTLATPDPTKDVLETFPLQHETVGVNLYEPDPAQSGVANWCAGCHGQFHGDVGGLEIGGTGSPPSHFIRHPSATVNIGALGGGHSSLGVFSGHDYRVRVMSASGDWGPNNGPWTALVLADGVTPTCLSCHKAHGSTRPFGLIFADGTGTPTGGPGENGNGSGARDLCKQCHVQG